MKKHEGRKIYEDYELWDLDLELWSMDLKTWNNEADGIEDCVSKINKKVKKHEEALMDQLTILMVHSSELFKHKKDIDDLMFGNPIGKKVFEHYNNDIENHKMYKSAHEKLRLQHSLIRLLLKDLKSMIDSFN